MRTVSRILFRLGAAGAVPVVLFVALRFWNVRLSRDTLPYCINVFDQFDTPKPDCQTVPSPPPGYKLDNEPYTPGVERARHYYPRNAELRTADRYFLFAKLCGAFAALCLLLSWVVRPPATKGEQK